MKFTGIIGVIVITVLVIMIASFTYVRVESLREEQMRIHNQFVEGFVISINQSGSVVYNDNTQTVWTIILSNNSIENSYSMIFDGTYPPQSDLSLRFYYKTYNYDDEYYYIITSVNLIN